MNGPGDNAALVDAFPDETVRNWIVALASDPDGPPSVAAPGVDVRGRDGLTPLGWSVLADDEPLFDRLLSLGADPLCALQDGMTVAHLAAMAADGSFVHTLLDRGLNPDTANDQTGETLLLAAMRSDREVTVARLLAAGASPNLPEASGATPVHVAAMLNAPHWTLDLLRAGATPSARDGAGNSFLRYLDVRPAGLSATVEASYAAVEDWLVTAGHDPAELRADGARGEGSRR